MFVQIHMLQSMPPGNLNRDDTGQPKKCIFGGVTRGRISSQCLKRNIRHSAQFKEAFPGEQLAYRTTYLPRMVGDELKKLVLGIEDGELNKVKSALARKFKAEERASEGAEGDGEDREQSEKTAVGDMDNTGQLVFFPPPFAGEIAKQIAGLRQKDAQLYETWVGGKKGKKKETDKYKDDIKQFEAEIAKKSQTLTVDIGLFGRMTTSDLVLNVEATCQVAHAISTHETMIESDYFTAMDDKKKEFAPGQIEQAGAAFLGSGETETFFDAAVYYKYLNLDIDALQRHLSWQTTEAAKAARVLVEASALANPTGKQNGFAAHGIPQLILIEVSKKKRPISYANAFLRPVEGLDLMAESAKALREYIEGVAAAFVPPDLQRVILAKGSASIDIKGAKRVDTLDGPDGLLNSFEKLLGEGVS